MVNGCRCWARVVVTRKSAWHWLAHPYCIRWYEEGSTSFGWSGEETEPSGTDGKTKEKRRPRGRRALSALLYFAATLRLLLLLSGHEFITSFVWRVRVSFAIHYSCGPPRPWGMRKCWGRETGTRSRPRSWAGGKRCTRTSNKKKILGRRTWRHCTAPRYSLSWSLSDVEKKKNLRETHCCCCWCCSIFLPFYYFFDVTRVSPWCRMPGSETISLDTWLTPAPDSTKKRWRGLRATMRSSSSSWHFSNATTVSING